MSNGLDTSIYSLLRAPKPIDLGPSPFQHAGQMMQLRQLISQGRLADLQRGEVERGIAEKGKLRDLFARGNVKPEEVMAIDPATGMQFQKSQLDVQKSGADLAKTRAEVLSKNLSIARDLVARASDDNGMRFARETTFRLLGPEYAAHIPETFDPQVQAKLVMTADKLIAEQEAQRGRDVTTRGQDLSASTARRGQDLTASTTQRGQTLTAQTTRRGQDLTESRERDVALQRSMASAREAGKNIAEAQQHLPQAVATAERGLRLIDELVGSVDGKTKPHPGLESAVGVSVSKAVSPFWAIPGTDRRDFEARLGEIKGGAFLQAFETLKGGGQITQVEGEKATQAITRMETAQSEEDFVKAAREFQDVIRKGMARAKAKAGNASVTAGGKGGIKFLGFE